MPKTISTPPVANGGTTIATVPHNVNSTPYNSNHHQSERRCWNSLRSRSQLTDPQPHFSVGTFVFSVAHDTDPFDFLDTGNRHWAPRAPPFNHRLEIEFRRPRRKFRQPLLLTEQCRPSRLSRLCGKCGRNRRSLMRKEVEIAGGQRPAECVSSSRTTALARHCLRQRLGCDSGAAPRPWPRRPPPACRRRWE